MKNMKTVKNSKKEGQKPKKVSRKPVRKSKQPRAVLDQDSDTWLQSADVLRMLLRDAINSHGGASSWAKSRKISAQYICDVLKGRAPVGPKIAAALGYKAETYFRPIRR